MDFKSTSSSSAEDFESIDSCWHEILNQEMHLHQKILNQHIYAQ
jgi:hypothetical protein